MKSMNGNLTSALFNFGAAELSKSRNGKTINVQPNRKRKSSNGSHQAVPKGRPAAFVAFGVPTKKAKRSHSLAVSVAQNTISISTHYVQKVWLTCNEVKNTSCF
jgi:hypothetical protein